MGNTNVLEAVVSKHKKSFVDSSLENRQKAISVAENMLLKIPKKPIPLEMGTRQVARMMYADNKYESLDLSFLSTNKVYAMNHKQQFNTGSSKKVDFVVNSLTAPMFGVIDYQNSDKFSLINGELSDIVLLKIPEGNNVTRNTVKPIKLGYTFDVDYSIDGDLPKFISDNLNKNIRMSGTFSTPFETFCVNHYYMREVQKDGWTRPIELLFKDEYRHSITFPKIVGKPFMIQTPDDVRDEYNKCLKLDVFDRFFLIFEVPKYEFRPSATDFKKDDPALVGYIKGSGKVHLIKMFYPTIAEEAIVYASKNSGKN